MNHSFFKKIAFVIFAAALLAGCGGKLSTTIDVKTGTAKTIYTEALKLGQLAYPGAYLFGYNNRGPSFDRPTGVPAQYETSGSSSYWFYIFTKNRENLSDGTITDNELFGVEYRAGDLTVIEEIALGEYTVTSDVLHGTELFAFDSDDIFTNALTAITKEAPTGFKPLHVDFRITPGVNEVSIFTTTGGGYSARYDMKKGESSEVSRFTVN